MTSWISLFAECDPAELTHELAAGFVEWQAQALDGAFSITGALRHESGDEILLATVQTERPQRPVVEIRHEEQIGIYFGGDPHGPVVFLLRDDFPDTPHQARNPVGFPLSICIDDRPWAEARVNYTPAELAMRILQWFRKAARGELHDPAQPMEPVFALHEPWEVIMPRGAWSAEQDNRYEMVGYVADKARPHIGTIRQVARGEGGDWLITVLGYDLSAQAVSRMRQAPATLQDLQTEALKRGVDIVEDLIERIRAWDADAQVRNKILKSRPCFVVRLPLINPLNNKVEGVDTVAFLSEGTVGDLGVALGIFFAETITELKTVGYQFRVTPGPQEPEKVRLLSCLVHAEFDTKLARQVSGRPKMMAGNVVMIGGGAIGSAVAESLVREGAFDAWTVVDDDTFLPHNIARHTLSAADVSRPKAAAVSARLQEIRPDIPITPLDENFLAQKQEESAKAMASADVIIDASASVAVGRRLCDLTVPARRASIFFNPTGTAGVMLVEDEGRQHDLRFLEALYHRAVLTSPELADHLRASETIRYTGACRMLTSRIPASRIQALSGLVADGVAKALVEPAAAVQIWSMADDGSVVVTKPLVDGGQEVIGDWVVHTPGDLSRELAEERQRQLPNETGGVLLGIVDPVGKRVDLVAALPAPPDSERSRTEFTRGVIGLREDVERAMERCAGQIRYVGEWHSHPQDSSSRPSVIDIEQLAWLTSTMSSDGMPGLMYILGESDTRKLVGTLA